MSMEIGNHVLDILPDYVLDILMDEEKKQVAAHLADCQNCQVEYTRLKQVADDLPLALVQAEPPIALKNKLMGEIHSRQGKSTATVSPSFWQRFTTYFRQSVPAWSLALIIVLALGNLLQWTQLNQVAGQITPSMRVITLANTNDSPQAVGTLVMDPQGKYGTLVVDHLSALDYDKQYQVWLIQDGKRTSAGLFSVNYEGYASLELLAPQPLIQYDAIGITVEPAGGSPGPTGAKVLGGDILR